MSQYRPVRGAGRDLFVLCLCLFGATLLSGCSDFKQILGWIRQCPMSSPSSCAPH